jgi:hypothetical protein
MNRFPLLILIPVLLAGCSGQSGTGGGGSGAGGNVDPDPGPVFPSTGVSDQNSFSISVDVFNPRGRDFDGSTVELTVRLADQLGNRLGSGVDVFWAADGGSIQNSCTTDNTGSCSVNWTSQEPRPAAGPAIADPLGSADTISQFSSGRATVLVWTLGTESFIDNNSNGLFDDGDTQVDDLPEAFIDKNEDGNRDTDEEFVNYPLVGLGVGGGSYDGTDGLYSGFNCAFVGECAVNTTVFNFRNIELSMSSDFICIEDVVFNAGGWWDTVDYSLAAPVDIKNTISTFSFLVHDCFGNPPMTGTEITFTSAVGELFSDEGPVDNTNVDMGVAVTGTLAPARERYPLNSVVFSATVLEALDNDEDEMGIFEITAESDLRAVTRFFYLLDPLDP